MQMAYGFARTGAVAASMMIATAACAAPDGACVPDAETAALRFVRLGWTDPRAAVRLIAPGPLARFRGRVEQLLEDRYSPMSAPLRQRGLGDDWSPARLHSASDAELVGTYMAFGVDKRRSASSSAPVVVSHVREDLGGDVIHVSYGGEVDGQARQFEYTVTGDIVQGCWMPDVPAAAWVNLAKLAAGLRQARGDVLPGREGPPLVKLEIVEAADEHEPGMVARADLRGGREAWIAPVPLAVESDVTGALASWDCSAGNGPAAAAVQIKVGADAGERIAQWSGSHIGSQMAIVIDGQVWTRATVQAVLGSTFTLCVPDDGHGLDRADRLAKALRGIR